MILGKLEKLKILSFTDQKRSEDKKIYEVMFNPESYSCNYKNVFRESPDINGHGQTYSSQSKSQNLSFKFLIDDSSATSGLLTGPSGNYDSSSLLGRASSVSMASTGNFAPRKLISDRVKEFLDLTFHVDGEIHEPRYLRIEWGDLRVDCRLESVEVNYTLFNRSGKPIRAELNTKFVADTDPQKQAALTNLQSADLTHNRQVTSQDTLPLMAHRIYQDPTQYIRVAQANKINNFRSLKPGNTLKFPPIANT